MKCKIVFFIILSLFIASCNNQPIVETASNSNEYGGIICLVANARADPSIAFSHPYQDGVKLRLGWQNVEPSDDVFDWSLIDAYVQEAKKQNQQLSISIAGGSTSPDWLIDQLDENEYVISRERTVPALWNELYMREYTEIIKRFGEKYANEPFVSHITISGIGFANEPVIPPEFDVTDLSNWSNAANEIIKTYIDSFPNTPMSIITYYQTPGKDNWEFFKQNILEPMYAQSTTAGVQFQGLDATASPNENDITDNYYAEISRVNDERTTGYQRVCSTIGNDVCQVDWVRGTSQDTNNLLERTLNARIANGADFIEVYANDCANPANKEILKETSIKMRSK